jgi:hypothetical protein
MADVNLDMLEFMIRTATNGTISLELPPLDDRALLGIMLLPRTAGIMLALIQQLREERARGANDAANQFAALANARKDKDNG